jgi:hypothetical protein
MSFTGIYTPEQLAVLAKVLNDHCASHGITPSSPEYTDASYLIMSLSQRGVGTVEELQAGLEGGVIATARGLSRRPKPSHDFQPRFPQENEADEQAERRNCQPFRDLAENSQSSAGFNTCRPDPELRNVPPEVLTSC